MGKPTNPQWEWLETLAAIVGAGQLTGPRANGSNSPTGQVLARGDFVSRQAARLVSQPKIPSPTDAAKNYEEKQNGKPTAPKEDSLPAAQFDRSKGVVEEEDGRLSAEV